MKKKRIFSIVAVLMLVIMTFSACGGGGEEEQAAADQATVTSDSFIAEDVASYLDKADMEYAYDLAYELGYNMDLADNELGWRTAGSDAEHKTADYLADEMEKIGLTDVEKVGVPVER